MILILDTSAAIEIVLQRDNSKRFSDHLSNADWVLVPDVFISEIVNVFWKYHQFDDLPLDICERGIENSIAIVDSIIDTKELYKEAFALSCISRHPVYDTLFLVLARRHNGTLLTLDKKLSRLALKHSIKTSETLIP